MPNLGSVLFFDEHWAQNTWPQLRQWCLRTVNVNWDRQRWHTSPSTQSGAMSDENMASASFSSGNLFWNSSQLALFAISSCTGVPQFFTMLSSVSSAYMAVIGFGDCIFFFSAPTAYLALEDKQGTTPQINQYFGFSVMIGSGAVTGPGLIPAALSCCLYFDSRAPIMMAVTIQIT
uniref:Uncharacterized protein n=1 Tax=Anopheles coluzzii TaxID=1518534 RepID=A0A8W7Q049_ANOCL